MKAGNGEERRTGAAKEKKIPTKVCGIAHEAKTKVISSSMQKTTNIFNKDQRTIKARGYFECWVLL